MDYNFIKMLIAKKAATNIWLQLSEQSGSTCQQSPRKAF